MIRNRLKSIRHQLEIDTQKEFAIFLGVARPQVNRWEKHKEQPTLETYYKLWKIIKTRLPDINLQDLFEDQE